VKNKNFARFGPSARTGKLGSAGNNPNYAVAAFPGRATGLCGLCGAQSRLGTASRRVADILPMFDCNAPEFAGNLAGESFASVLENHPSYPNLRSGRHRALFERLDDIVADHIDSLAGILRGLGFDEVGAAIYRSAALTAFRASRPDQPQNRSRH
jgi:hypothetical protein